MLPLLALLSCGIIDPLDTTGDAEYQSYTGSERFIMERSAGSTDCALYWSAEGSPATIACPTCTFAFDIDFTLDPTQSTDDGSCLAMQRDFSATYVLIGDEIGIWDGGTINLFGAAQLDPAAGRFTYASDSSPYTSYAGYYDTWQTTGTATVQ
jgi:hypothetical protein